MSNVKPNDLALSSHPKAPGLVVTILRQAFEGDQMPGHERMIIGPLTKGLTWWVKPPRPFTTASGHVLTELVIPDCWLRRVGGSRRGVMCRDEVTDKLRQVSEKVKELLA